MLISRQKKLLNILDQDKKWHTFSEISLELKCSTKTVQRDLKVIKDFLPSQWTLNICKGKGVILYKPPYKSSSELNFLFIREEITFKIIDMFFKNQVNTVVDLSYKLYMPIKKIYDYLKRVEQFLERFKLTLKRKPLSIQGNFVNIIFMYQEFYIQSYGDHEWPFEGVNDVVLYQYATKIEKKLNIILCPLYKRKLVYLIAIMIKFKIKNHRINFNPKFINEMKNTPMYQKLLLLNHTNKAPLLFSTKELIIFVIAINCSKFIYKDLPMHKLEILRDFKSGNVFIYKLIKDFIIDLDDIFGNFLLDNDEFVFSIIQYLKYTLSKKYFFPSIDLSSNESIHYIKKHHSETFSKVCKAYKQWLEKYNIQNFISDEEITTLTIHVESVLMLSNTVSIKTLLLIDDSEKWGQYIKGILNLYFGNIFFFINIEIHDTQNYDYATLDIDLIITTFIKIQSSIPIIKISIVPTSRELHDIKEFINKI